MADLEVASAKGVYRKMDMIKAVNLKKYYTSNDVFKMEVAAGFFHDGGATITLK